MLTSLYGESPTSWIHPCLRCGACCAHFRASFYWAEASDATANGVPVELTHQISPYLRVMRGTDQAQPRCVALQGAIGQSVRCSVHPQRSSVCRDFTPSYEDGMNNPRCDAARAAHGLAPLQLTDWVRQPDSEPPSRPPHLPQAA